ncbi:MAG: Si-specific NAD(P)(+) transhydrogenase [Ardenticatenaceae bacterium]|nr:Si-specific NAD(P)(+) transhydrogenase [Ardenticatenaceae bacterium]
MSEHDYDLLVIGTGPSGQKAAVQGAKAGKKVAIIDKRDYVGGVCVNTGTIPSKTLREAVLYLSGFRERNIYGASYRVKQNITMDDLKFRCDHVIRHEMDVIKHQMYRNNIELINGTASFADSHCLRVVTLDGDRLLTADHIVIAVGTTPTLVSGIPFTEDKIVTSDGMLDLSSIPRSLCVVGGGVIGIEYASIFAALGVRVTVIDMRSELLGFVDDEVIGALTYHLRQQRVTVRLGEKVESLHLDPETGKVVTQLASGKRVITEKALYSIGRTGATDKLNLEAAGLKADTRGRLAVNPNYQTEVPHIYAVGDVIGFPSLASTSMEQGRLAAAHAFGIKTSSIPDLFPYGIYTIPEISMVGKTEEELTQAGVPYEIGKAHYREISRGQIIGDEIGMLKLIFGLEDRKLLGAHIIGEGSSELVHIGQAVMAFGGTVDYFVNTVFNYPTLAEAYKVAALDGINRMDA